MRYWIGPIALIAALIAFFTAIFWFIIADGRASDARFRDECHAKGGHIERLEPNGTICLDNDGRLIRVVGK